MDGRETVMTGWTEGKLWEIAWGDPRLGVHAGMRTGWIETMPWEIACGELRWEGAIRE